MKQLNTKNIGITGPLPGFQYNDSMCFGDNYHVTYRPMAVALCDRFQPKSVLELGAGCGSLARHMREYRPGLRVITLEGNPDTRQSPHVHPEDHFIVRTDQEVILSENDTLAQFDLIVSFEHFEHIHPDRFGVFMANMLRHAAPKATLVATASNWWYPGGSDVHCNVQDPAAWDRLLRSHGLQPAGISVLCPATKPFNFEIHLTTELVYFFP